MLLALAVMWSIQTASVKVLTSRPAVKAAAGNLSLETFMCKVDGLVDLWLTAAREEGANESFHRSVYGISTV